MIRDYYEHIEDYLNGTLSDADRKSFETEMKRDPGLELVVKHYSTIMDALEIAAQKTVNDALTKIHRNGNGVLRNQKLPVIRRLYNNLAVRAAAILLVITSGFLIYANLNYDATKLAKRAYVSLADLTLQGTDDNGQIAIEETPDMPLDLRYQYAHELFAGERYEEAQKQFERIAESGDLRFSEGAEYFAAICILLQGKKTEALDKLEHIQNSPDHIHNKRAGALKENLTGFWSHFTF